MVGGKYRIERVIGRGGMGMVYEGVHTRIQRHVAIKVLHDHLVEDGQSLRRFEREAQAAARIGSEHIVDVYDVGELETGEHYIVMELLQGETLSSFMKRRVSTPELAAIVIELLEGLSDAHVANIVHRDLKPANILVVEGTRKRGPMVKILDFGVSKFRDLTGEGSTTTGTLIGTPHFMAPEQLKEHDVDGRADLYSVGVILFRAVARRYPYKAKTLPALLGQLMSTDPPAVATVANVDTVLAAVIDKALSRDRNARFQSAREMADAMRAYLVSTGEQHVAVPAPLQSRTGLFEQETPSSNTFGENEATTLVTPPATGEIDVSLTEVMMTPEPISAGSVEQASLVSQTVVARRAGGRSSGTVVLLAGLTIAGAAGGAVYYMKTQPEHVVPAARAVASTQAPEVVASTTASASATVAASAATAPLPSASVSASASASASVAPKVVARPRSQPRAPTSSTPATKPTSTARTDAIREDL